MNKIAAFVLGLALAMPAFAQSRFPGPSSIPLESAETIQTLHLFAWGAACSLKKAKCERYQMPQVAYGLLPGEYGKFRPGTSVVLLDMRIVGQELAVVVLVHEMIHYLQDLENPLRTGPLTVAVACADEEEAFRLAYDFARLNDIAMKDPRLDTWESALPKYPFCPQVKK